MDIIGRIAYLTPEEQRVSGCESPIDVADIDIVSCMAAIAERRHDITEVLTCDDQSADRILERAHACDDIERVEADSLILQTMAAELTGVQVEIQLIKTGQIALE